MKLLVLAQVPPPIHGQNLMVERLIRGLEKSPIKVVHVGLPLSRNHGDIGAWRPGKAWTLWRAAAEAVSVAKSERADALYYVPAPGKRGAAWRDILLMGAVRPHVPKLVLHWHATGLSEWMSRSATFLERRALVRSLGRADLSIALADSLSADARAFAPKRVSVVPNGIEDPGAIASPASDGSPKQVLFIGQCSRAKGLFAAMDAVASANRTGSRCKLVVAGAFAASSDRAEFEKRAAAAPLQFEYAGEVSGAEKRALFLKSHCLCFPTQYPHEGQPLVIIEATAYGIPVVATRWRAIPEMVNDDTGVLSEPGDSETLAANLRTVLETEPDPQRIRNSFLSRFSLDRHIDAIASELLSLSGT